MCFICISNDKFVIMFYFDFFSVCVSINKVPSGVELKCRQNKIDGLSLVLFVFYSYVNIRAFKMTIHPGRIIQSQVMLLLAAFWWGCWLKCDPWPTSLAFPSVSDTAGTRGPAVYRTCAPFHCQCVCCKPWQLLTLSLPGIFPAVGSKFYHVCVVQPPY